MGKPCEIEICGKFISDNEAEQFHRFIKERIAAYKAVGSLWDDIDSSTEILCDHCGKPFCSKCYEQRVYNGKSLAKMTKIFDKKFNTLETKTFLSDMYLCPTCAPISTASHCRKCGKSLGEDREGTFSGRHVGVHVKCKQCNAVICLDCATHSDSPTKFPKNCPVCEKSKWLPVKAKLLFKNYATNIIYLNERQNHICCGCTREKTITLFCSVCNLTYCPTCVADHPQSAKGICPNCGKKGFKEFRDELLSLAEHTHDLPALDGGEVEDEQIEIDVIHPTMPVPDDSELGAIPDKENSEEIRNSKTIKETDEIDRIEGPTRIITPVSSHPVVEGSSSNLKEDLSRFVRVCNLIQDLSDILKDMLYTIQFHVEGAKSFYFRIRDGQIHGFSGTLSGSPDVFSDMISLQEAQYVLQGNPNADLSYLHVNNDDDEDLIDHFLRIHELFDIIVHA